MALGNSPWLISQTVWINCATFLDVRTRFELIFYKNITTGAPKASIVNPYSKQLYCRCQLQSEGPKLYCDLLSKNLTQPVFYPTSHYLLEMGSDGDIFVVTTSGFIENLNVFMHAYYFQKKMEIQEIMCNLISQLSRILASLTTHLST